MLVYRTVYRDGYFLEVPPGFITLGVPYGVPDGSMLHLTAEGSKVVSLPFLDRSYVEVPVDSAMVLLLVGWLFLAIASASDESYLKWYTQKALDALTEEYL